MLASPLGLRAALLQLSRAGPGLHVINISQQPQSYMEADAVVGLDLLLNSALPISPKNAAHPMNPSHNIAQRAAGTLVPLGSQFGDACGLPWTTKFGSELCPR